VRCTRQHTSAYVYIRPHTSAYVYIRPHTSAYEKTRNKKIGKHLEKKKMFSSKRTRTLLSAINIFEGSLVQDPKCQSITSAKHAK
jgi:hypothetical protein